MRDDVNVRDIDSVDKQVIEAMMTDSMYGFILGVMIVLPLLLIGMAMKYPFNALKYAFVFIGAMEIGYSVYVLVKYYSVKQEYTDFINAFSIPDKEKADILKNGMKVLEDKLGTRCYGLAVVGILLGGYLLIKGGMMFRQGDGKVKKSRR